jgi:hypothetical protein
MSAVSSVTWHPLTKFTVFSKEHHGGLYLHDDGIDANRGHQAGVPHVGADRTSSHWDRRARHELIAEAFGGKGYGKRTSGDPQPQQRSHPIVSAGG